MKNAAGGGGVSNPEYGALKYLLISILVILIILIVNRFFSGFIRTLAVIIGLVLGPIIATAVGMSDFCQLHSAELFKSITPFAFGLPTFTIQGSVSMCIVMLVIMTESTGMFFAIGNIANTKVDQNALKREYRAEGLGAVLGRCF